MRNSHRASIIGFDLRNKINRYNMKLLKLTIVALCLFIAPQTRAQEVFNQVVANAKNLIDDPRTDPFMLNVAQFKFTAMQYLCNTAIKRNGGQVSADFLNRQAASMNDFLTSYLRSYLQAQSKGTSAQKEVVKKYWQISVGNPLFNDQDQETIGAFLNDPDCVTPFSLDTDWEKADAAIGN